MQLWARERFAEFTRYGRLVIGRRALLVTGALALTGCTVVNVTLPWNPPSPLAIEPTPGLPAQLARAIALSRHLREHAAAWKLDARRVTALDWFGSAVDDQARVLLSKDPARLQRVTTPLPTSSTPSQTSAAATWSALTALLTALRGQHRARALRADGPAALLWASLAAFSATMAARLPSGIGKLGDDTAELTPDLTGTGTAQVLALCLQGAYSYELALAAPTLATADEHRLQQRLRAWRTLREQLLALGDVQASPPPVGYDLRPATNRAGAFSLAATAESAALPVFGAWLAGTASVAERTIGVDAIAAAHTSLVGFGGAAQRWPGWPS